MVPTSGQQPPHIGILAHLHLDRSENSPLHQQLYDGLRQAILTREFEPGVRLPSTRSMATTLGISRNTVLNAVEQLHAEGYLESRIGAGTFVTSQLPEELLQATFIQKENENEKKRGTPRTLSRRGRILNRARQEGAYEPVGDSPIAFEPGIAALSLFPFQTWSRLHRRFCQRAPSFLATYGLEPAGYFPLRQNIADFLKRTRAISCSPEQIIITSGSQEALYLAAQVLLDPGDQAIIEEPGYLGTILAVGSSGGRIVPISIDDEGLAIYQAADRAPNARAAFITPSHQFPLGITMSLRRRLEMLSWADRQDSWIVEDDYDSLYRYEGKPLAALQGLDNNRRVLYVGTFSKVLFTGLRLGFIVVPPDIVEAFLALRACIDLAPPVISQVVLNQFIEEGHFNRHLRKMQNLYRERRDAFVVAMEKWIGSQMTIGPTDSGMHVTGLFTGDIDDLAVREAAFARGVQVTPLSRLFWGTPTLSGITFGFVNLTPEQIETGIQHIARALEDIG